jgi:hypothetical protein
MTGRGHGAGAGPGLPAVSACLIFQRYLVQGPTLGDGKLLTTTRGMHT